jgi:hypothetical protein
LPALAPEIICWFPEWTQYPNFWTTSQRAIKVDEAHRDMLMRMVAFENVRRLNEAHDHLTTAELKPGFVYEGERFPLINSQRGIFKPLRYLKRMGCSPTGQPSLTISNSIGRLTMTTLTSISSAMAPRQWRAACMGNARWRRLSEERAGSAKSVFHLDVQGSVAESTHAGIPWPRFIRQQLGGAFISGCSMSGRYPADRVKMTEAVFESYDPSSDGAPRSMNSRRLPTRTFA